MTSMQEILNRLHRYRVNRAVLKLARQKARLNNYNCRLRPAIWRAQVREEGRTYCRVLSQQLRAEML